VDKAPDAFRTISEVAEDLDVPQHVLRFWESRFSQIRPMKRAGGRRYYRADDVDLLRGIRQLLYSEGYTIRGVQRILKEHGINFVQTVWQEGSAQPPRLPDDDMADDAADSARDETATAQGLRGLLPSLSKQPERREPRLDSAAGEVRGKNDSAAASPQQRLLACHPPHRAATTCASCRRCCMNLPNADVCSTASCARF